MPADASAVVRVVLVPSPGRIAPLDYRAPASLAPGTRVLVPIGARRAMGVVLEDGAPRDGLRDVVAVLDDQPVLDESLMRLAAWMAGYYLSPLGEVVSTALPGALRVETERHAALLGPPPGDLSPVEAELATSLAIGPTPLATIAPPASAAAARCRPCAARRGGGQRAPAPRGRAHRRQRFYEAAATVDDAHPALACRPALRALYAYLRDHPLRRAPERTLRHRFLDARGQAARARRRRPGAAREEEQY
ncbi:MAG: hypothetical protein U0802_20900 [Candidatus Binatia bacterium]